MLPTSVEAGLGEHNLFILLFLLNSIERLLPRLIYNQDTQILKYPYHNYHHSTGYEPGLQDTLKPLQSIRRNFSVETTLKISVQKKLPNPLTSSDHLQKDV